MHIRPLQPLALAGGFLAAVVTASAGAAASLSADEFRERFLAALQRQDEAAMLDLVRANRPRARESVEGLLSAHTASAAEGKAERARRLLEVARRLAGLYRLAFQDALLEAKVRLHGGWAPDQARRKRRADQLLLQGPGPDPASAAERLREALEINREIGDAGGMADALEMLGDLRWARREVPAARHAYREALGLARAGGDRRGAARLLNKAGNMDARRGEAAAALDAYREALALARAEGEQRLEGEILHNLGNLLLDRRGDAAGALAAYREGLAIVRALGDRPGEAATLTAIGLALASRGEPAAAVQHLEEALAIRRALADPKGIGVTLNNLGAVLLELGRSRLALERHREAMTFFLQAGDDEGVAATLMNLGSVHFELGEYESAFRFQGEALATFRRLGDGRGAAEALGNLGALYHEVGDLQRALEHLVEARGHLKATGDARGEALQLANLGAVYEQLGRLAEAAAAYAAARSLAAGVGDLAGQGGSLLGLAILAERRGDAPEAERLYREALGLFRRAGAARGEVIALGNLGFLLLKGGRPAEARPALEEAVRRAAAAGTMEPRWYVENRLGFLRELEGDPETALAHYLRGIEAVEALRAGLGRHAPRVRFLERRTLAYDQPLRLLARRPAAERIPPGSPLARAGRTYGEAAFHLAERGKARAFLELLGRARASAGGGGLPPGLREEEQAILGRVARLERDLADPFQPGPAGERAEALREARAALAAFIQKLRRTHPAYAILKYPEPIRVADLPLRPHEILLAYKVTDGETFLWVVRGRAIVKAVTIPRTREQLREMVRRFRLPLEDPARLAAFRPELGEALYRLLLAEALEGQDPRGRLVILPDDVLHLLPFEALLSLRGGPGAEAGGATGAGPGSVGDDWQVSYYPSATVLAINRHGAAGRPRPPLPLFALGDPVYDEGDPRAGGMRAGGGARTAEAGGPAGQAGAGEFLAAVRDASQARGYGSFRRLRGAGREVRQVAAVFGVPAAPPPVLLGLAATKAALLQADLTRYRYLHLATHGILAGDLPFLREPALVLSLVGLAGPQDGFLTMSEVFDLRVGADVAALSACRTALGEAIAGEGIVGLSRAFLYAGASSVLVSLWPVEDEATAHIMERFYWYLTKGGLGRADALRRARQAIRRGFVAPDGTPFPAHPHPFFWAPFILIGEAD